MIFDDIRIHINQLNREDQTNLIYVNFNIRIDFHPLFKGENGKLRMKLRNMCLV